MSKKLIVCDQSGHVYFGEDDFQFELYNNQHEIVEYVQSLLDAAEPKWIDITDDNYDLSEGKYYWVQFPDGKIKMCQLNDYRQYGAFVNYWQGADGNDVSLELTKYIEILKPEASK